MILVASPAVTVQSGCGEDAPVETWIATSYSAPLELDPATAADDASLEALWLVHTPLLTYRHAGGERGTQLIPALAEELPRVSADGLTYSLTLRDDLVYSDGSRVRAGDFERAIMRALRLRSPNAAPYEGITGIEVEGSRIEVELIAPDPEFADALAHPAAAPVPADTPLRHLGASPPPGVGPYEISEATAEGEFVLRRSERFAELGIDEIPTGEIDEIRASVIPSLRVQAQGVLDGRLDYMQGRPPVALEPTIVKQASDRFAERAIPATDLIWFDPASRFGDPLMREAVARGIDRRRLGRALADGVDPGCAVLAPGVGGYQRALDTACPYPAPDRRVAAELVDEADARGARIVVAAGSGARAYARSLRSISLDARIARGAAQTGVRALRPAAPRAGAFFGALGLDDPLVVADLGLYAASAGAEPSTEEWGELDQHVMSPPQAYVVPLGHPTATTFLSERIEPSSAVLHPVFRNDYSRWRLKEGE